MRILKVVFIVLLLLIIVVAGLIYTAYKLDLPPQGNSEEMIFVINQGESFNEVTERLYKEGIIRSRTLLKIIGRIKGTDKAIKKGYYAIMPEYTTLQVHDLLVSGKEILNKLTIPEGWTSSQIALLLEQRGYATKDQVLRQLQNRDFLIGFGITADSGEGYLFPDTYFFPENYPIEKLLSHMITTFFLRLEEIKPDYKDLSPEEIHNRIIMASIVEREYRISAEASIIASVFYNRLSLRMPLQSCATVAYVITEILGKPYPERLFYRDLEVDSPYNTYKYSGLPAGPICNPSKTALEASFYPSETEYIYFVLQDLESGRHHFSRTLTEHSNAFSLFVKKR